MFPHLRATTNIYVVFLHVLYVTTTMNYTNIIKWFSSLCSLNKPPKHKKLTSFGIRDIFLSSPSEDLCVVVVNTADVLFSPDVSRLRGRNRPQDVSGLLLFLINTLQFLPLIWPFSPLNSILISSLTCLSAASSSSVFLFHLPPGANWGISSCSQHNTLRGKW